MPAPRSGAGGDVAAKRPHESAKRRLICRAQSQRDCALGAARERMVAAGARFARLYRQPRPALAQAAEHNDLRNRVAVSQAADCGRRRRLAVAACRPTPLRARYMCLATPTGHTPRRRRGVWPKPVAVGGRGIRRCAASFAMRRGRWGDTRRAKRQGWD
ncbi:MAG: hypothetical protein Pg6A_07260 [Termitinemataceae bacterium]|nr:MAG: hypothetical protein Pg6A_07260 [Termitinemataceae bacterium]